MAQVINTNSISLMAQNNLNKSQSALGTAIERLSSGLRINSAKDDAAGQAISNRFTSNINGLTQASRNANDGISLAQTTEGALDEINDNLQAIRTLTVQSQTGTNSTSDLQSIQDEVTQRLAEIDRISQQTDFNGVKVLSSDKSLSIQVDANDGETISIDLKKIDSNSLKLGTFNVNGPTQTGVTVAPTTNVGATGSVSVSSVTLSAGTNAAKADIEAGSLVKNDDGYFVKTSDGDYYAATVSTDGSGKLTATVAADAKATTPGITDSTAASNVDSAKTPLVQDKNGHYFIKDETAGSTDATVKYYAAKVTTDDDGNVTAASYDSSKALTTATSDPLANLDDALSTVDTMRSNLGAVQNRFESTINNLTSSTSNLSEAQSRIQDADYATEVSNMSKAQILQQAGTSVLAQANQVPQTVLSLLQ
ncbi:FliC/FljB family flagellin [Candidatus Sodalis endolongispinus]|uniref:Flagellin n=1 Tax=Candidatus Sodalis endolongispinus TaxID=2812662 RepID=A0ABS5Y7N3_9GAMM|nr:FliC/FljB family flagellin [Candidatus Sodalis endolongispinus]MBT9431011.1 FliC/FljB family flagellin [Candidatus Sodalis endolongispinus]